MRRRPSPQPELPLPPPGPRKTPAELRAAAEATLERRRQRQLVKALSVELALEEECRRTEARLRRQEERVARLREDARLEALLAARRAGRPVAEALAEVDRRFSAAAARSARRSFAADGSDPVPRLPLGDASDEATPDASRRRPRARAGP